MHKNRMTKLKTETTVRPNDQLQLIWSYAVVVPIRRFMSIKYASHLGSNQGSKYCGMGQADQG